MMCSGVISSVVIRSHGSGMVGNSILGGGRVERLRVIRSRVVHLELVRSEVKVCSEVI